MKTLSKYFVSITILFSIPIAIHSQPADHLKITGDTPLFYPKTYLHTDREVYFTGDSIWFKAYYLDGLTQIFLPGDYSLYTELLDEGGRAVISQVLILEDGQTTGKMELPDTVRPGNYLLRAFTDYQRSLGEDACFHRKIKITSVESRMEEAASRSEDSPTLVDVAFLPEGGILLPEKMNTVGFKAVDERGVGISLNGEIVDGQGTVVSTFETAYKGMGQFHFQPRQGAHYRVRIPACPEFEYSFDDLVQDGIKIEYSGESNDNLLFTVSTSAEANQGRACYFAILHRGRVLFSQKFIQKGEVLPLKIQKTALSPGINRFVLLDEQFRPVSERLYFSDNIDLNNIQIRPDRESYVPRSEVQLELFDEEPDQTGFSNVSVAVIDAYALGADGPGLNILSWLLIDSELKGNIESPAQFFKDDDSLTSAEKLNLLMLTQGWSRYTWTGLAEDPPFPEPVLTEGIIVQGTVKHALTKKPVARGEVDLLIYSREGFVKTEGKTDKDGRFLFENVVFTDTAGIFIQGRNKKGKLYTEVNMDPIFNPVPLLPDLYLPKETRRSYSSKLYEQQYYSDQDLKNFALEHGSILLEEVSITRNQNKGDGHFRMYMKPHDSMTVTERDYAYRNIADYLQGRVAGVVVIGNSIMIHGRGSFSPVPPLYLLNGSPMPEDAVMHISMSEIDVVEVLKNPAEAAIFGVNAGGGVISVFTKKGAAGLGSRSYVQGTISKKLQGYAGYREFYAPKYTSQNRSSIQPDHRLTLHWEPIVYTVEGKAVVSFFTSDDITRYTVLVEGITQNGKLCTGTAEFDVNSKTLISPEPNY